jgi:ATPase subunit of ABC transporter with duplicated ATPase domains
LTAALLCRVRDVGLTVVATSHDDELLVAVADHVHDLAGADGDVRRAQAGTPAASTIGPPSGW